MLHCQAWNNKELAKRGIKLGFFLETLSFFFQYLALSVMQLFVEGGMTVCGSYGPVTAVTQTGTPMRRGAKWILTNPSTSCLNVVSKEPSACKTNNYCDTMHPHEHILSTFKHIINSLTFDIRRRLSISCLGWCQSKNSATAVPNESAKHRHFWSTISLLISSEPRALTPHYSILSREKSHLIPCVLWLGCEIYHY